MEDCGGRRYSGKAAVGRKARRGAETELDGFSRAPPPRYLPLCLLLVHARLSIVGVVVYVYMEPSSVSTIPYICDNNSVSYLTMCACIRQFSP